LDRVVALAVEGAAVESKQARLTGADAQPAALTAFGIDRHRAAGHQVLSGFKWRKGIDLLRSKAASDGSGPNPMVALSRIDGQ
jgi:hypothetical protein